MHELIKEIIGFPCYQVSNLGSVYSLRFNKVKVLKPSICSDGYFRVCLYKVDEPGKPYGFLVHRLVLTMFVGPCPDDYVACHYDGNKSNNNLSNLRWDTQKANEHDKERHGTYLNGKVISDNCKQAAIKARTGLKHSPEVRRKISEAVRTSKKRAKEQTQVVIV